VLPVDSVAHVKPFQNEKAGILTRFAGSENFDDIVKETVKETV
jgi:hypothetical protein